MKHVLILQIMFKRDLEYCENELRIIQRAIAQTYKRAMHTSRNIGFVVTTSESSKDLMDRLQSVLDEGPIEAMWCYSAPADLVSSRGGLDSLETYIKFANAEIGKRHNPEYVREIEVRAPRGQFQGAKNRIGRTPI